MDGDAVHSLKLFIPQVCLQSLSGLLLGFKKRIGNQTYYTITAVAENQMQQAQNSTSAYGSLLLPSEILGVILDAEDIMKVGDLKMLTSMIHSDWILIERVDNKEPTVKLMDYDAVVTCNDVLVVVYDGIEFMSSAYLMDTPYSQIENCEHMTNIGIIANSLASYKQLKDSLPESQSFYMNDCLPHRIRPFYWMLYRIEAVLCALLYVFISVISTLSKCMPLYWPFGVCHSPAVYSQLKRRFCQLRTALSLQGTSPLTTFKSRNLLCLHVFDVCLGLALTTWLLSDNRAQLLSEIVMTWAENVAAYLQNLLQWMMGSPAGLKLNRQLSQLLGKFFTYHIYLWSGYLGVLRPVQVSIVQVIAGSGVLGLSVQLALMRDLVSMMTIHIYCFYVYAARLYCLQVYAVSSLWRLFRGKKWNTLRCRIDSATFDMDQLFLGTLLFTILLFLLPTTALYYTVFMGLRLVVLGIHGALYSAIYTLNVFPAASLAARVFSPAIVSDRVKFSAAPKLDGRPLYLYMKTQPAPLTTLMTSLSKDDIRPNTNSWGSFLKKLAVGDLVYPWIEPVKEKVD